MNDQIQQEAEDIGRQGGFVTIVPDLYRGKVAVDNEQANHEMSNLDWPGAVKDIQAAVLHLKQLGCKKVCVMYNHVSLPAKLCHYIWYCFQYICSSMGNLLTQICLTRISGFIIRIVPSVPISFLFLAFIKTQTCIDLVLFILLSVSFGHYELNDPWPIIVAYVCLVVHE